MHLETAHVRVFFSTTFTRHRRPSDFHFESVWCGGAPYRVVKLQAGGRQGLDYHLVILIDDVLLLREVLSEDGQEEGSKELPVADSLDHDSLIGAVGEQGDLLVIKDKLSQGIDLLPVDLLVDPDLFEDSLTLALDQDLVGGEAFPVGDEGKEDLAEGSGAQLEMGRLEGVADRLDHADLGVAEQDLGGLSVIENIVVDDSSFERFFNTFLGGRR